jgi:hypothetical protein
VERVTVSASQLSLLWKGFGPDLLDATILVPAASKLVRAGRRWYSGVSSLRGWVEKDRGFLLSRSRCEGIDLEWSVGVLYGYQSVDTGVSLLIGSMTFPLLYKPLRGSAARR